MVPLITKIWKIYTVQQNHPLMHGCTWKFNLFQNDSASQNPNHPLTVSFAYILIRIIRYIMLLNGIHQNTFSLKCKLLHDENFQISGLRYFYNIRSKMFSSAITE